MTSPSIEIRELSPLHVLSVSHVGPYPEIHHAFAQLADWLNARDLFRPDTRCLAIFHDDPSVVPADRLRSEACFALGAATATLAVEPPVEHRTIAGGPYAVLQHRGPYAMLGDSYAWLHGHWLPASGREAAAAPSFEHYLNDPRTTPPADLLTEICVPLR